MAYLANMKNGLSLLATFIAVVFPLLSVGAVPTELQGLENCRAIVIKNLQRSFEPEKLTAWEGKTLVIRSMIDANAGYLFCQESDLNGQLVSFYGEPMPYALNGLYCFYYGSEMPNRTQPNAKRFFSRWGAGTTDFHSSLSTKGTWEFSAQKYAPESANCLGLSAVSPCKSPLSGQETLQQTRVLQQVEGGLGAGNFCTNMDLKALNLGIGQDALTSLSRFYGLTSLMRDVQCNAGEALFLRLVDGQINGTNCDVRAEVYCDPGGVPWVIDDGGQYAWNSEYRGACPAPVGAIKGLASCDETNYNTPEALNCDIVTVQEKSALTVPEDFNSLRVDLKMPNFTFTSNNDKTSRNCQIGKISIGDIQLADCSDQADPNYEMCSLGCDMTYYDITSNEAKTDNCLHYPKILVIPSILKQMAASEPGVSAFFDNATSKIQLKVEVKIDTDYLDIDPGNYLSNISSTSFATTQNTAANYHHCNLVVSVQKELATLDSVTCRMTTNGNNASPVYKSNIQNLSEFVSAINQNRQSCP